MGISISASASISVRTSTIDSISISRIPFGDHLLKLERYREDYHGPCTRMTGTHREVHNIVSMCVCIYIYIYIYIDVSHVRLVGKGLDSAVP